MAARVLYISYDGALEPLGQSQVVAYLCGLADRGAGVITLLSYEKPADIADAARVAALRARLDAHDVRWVRLTYHKRPSLLATLFDVAAGIVRGALLVRRDRISVVHARSYVGALIGWALKRSLGVRLIFDMRGFWADERVEGGLWPGKTLVYRIVKRLERWFLRDADEIVTLGERARGIVEGWPGIAVRRVTMIPTCVDLERFTVSRAPRAQRTRRSFVYAGSVGTWYLLPEMLAFVAEAGRRSPGVRFELLTRQLDEAARCIAAGDTAAVEMVTRSIPPGEVPARLAAADAGLAFYKPGFSRQGTCPTKVGEYLAAGLPVVVNDAVGDMERIVGGARVGAVLSDFSLEAYHSALSELEKLWDDPELSLRCRRVAETHFSLSMGIERYAAIYGRSACP